MSLSDKDLASFHEMKTMLTGKLMGTLNTKIDRSARHFSELFKDESIIKKVKKLTKPEDKLDLFLDIISSKINPSPTQKTEPKIKEKIVKDVVIEFDNKYKTYTSLMDGNPAVTLQAAADFLSCSPGMVKSLVKDGKLREVYIRSRVYISKKDLMKLYDSIK